MAGEKMKGIKDWQKDVEADEELMRKFEDLEEVEDVIKLAEELGYKFTDDEFMDLQMEMVSGGRRDISMMCNLPTINGIFRH